jgi:uncharacterized protein YndB with AHSA1/START domain
MTATLHSGDGRDTLRFERALAHPRERVWRAVTDPVELSVWFPSAVVYEPRVGAPMQFDFGGEHGLDVWPGEVLEWDGDGTALVFTHAFAHQPGKPARDGAGWATCLDALDGLLGGEGGAGHDWSAHHEAHLARRPSGGQRRLRRGHGRARGARARRRAGRRRGRGRALGNRRRPRRDARHRRAAGPARHVR